MSINDDTRELKELMQQRAEISKRIRELQKQAYTAGTVRFCRDPYSSWHSWRLQVNVDGKKWRTAFEVRERDDAVQMLDIVKNDIIMLCASVKGKKEA